MKCKARQYSDTMMCPCGLQWDVNDPDPPTCSGQPKKSKKPKKTQYATSKDWQALKDSLK